ncbi:hypothetical protein DBR32_09510 [Taibaiella sp. KBW10]|uniref:hypothetical protein n=1 Tax=Taibaiella sp. KBW10 TaxID=2153357 RepID=UPI000F5A5621|nr:hypothetical protein [Taibaiella sp. KBW10]RQO30938.1 hypothetical protein DBR32_09510 [Taibaiella sp. KBW10]
MKPIVLLLLSITTFICQAQTADTGRLGLTVSPVIDQSNPTNKEIIKTLNLFLQTKNTSLTENKYWHTDDFNRYVYPYLDIFHVESSKYGEDFFKPSLMEILPTGKEAQKIVKIAFIGYNESTNERQLKSIFNLIANIEGEIIRFSRYLDYATSSWRSHTAGSLHYKISPNKTVNKTEVRKQAREIKRLCAFFQTKPLHITYYSCINPKEVFEIKGFDYNPMMYVDQRGGLADFGDLVFSGNNAELYTHEVIHIYTKHLYPNINKFIDEGIATYISGSGLYDYAWHRHKLKKWLLENPEADFARFMDTYQRQYFEQETSIPYLTAALICERTYRMYGKEKLFALMKSEQDIWIILKEVGLNKDNINEALRQELSKPLKPVR